MAKKTLKKKVAQKHAGKSNSPAAAVTKAAAPVVESAREIWLAGLGAFNVAQQEGYKVLEEGSKIFEKLVAEGTKIEAKTRKEVQGAVSDIRSEVENRVMGARNQADAVRKQAVDNWDKLEKIFEERVARSLTKLGIPSQDDVNKLTARVTQLSKQLDEIAGKPTKASTSAKVAGKKPASKPTGGKVAKPAAARKTSRKPAAKKAASKATSPAA
jgi:poly(hydroxyalkanoate) granule-associated protein